MYKGIGNYTNMSQPVVSEYIQRQRLAKLGYTSDISKLPTWKAEAFCLIGSEVDRLQSEDMKQKHNKR